MTIWDGDVPTTYKKVWDPEEEEWVYVPEEDVPTTWKEGVPATGDSGLVWAGAALLSGGILAAVLLLKKKDKKH